MMKHKLKQSILNYVLTPKELKRLQTNEVNFPGGIFPINKTQENDVFVVGFPKSGNTLMQHIISHLVYGLNDEGSRSMVNLIVPDVYANSHYFRFNERCFFKSHDLPKPEYKKVIYIMRDGREALLSYYNMLKNMGKSITLEDLYTEKTKILNTTWSEHIEKWEQNIYQADILWLKFEDLKANKLLELKRICKFLKIERTREELDNVINNSSLDHMRSLEKKNDWDAMKNSMNLNKGSFVGDGKKNNYVKVVSKNHVKCFEDLNQAILKKYYG